MNKNPKVTLHYDPAQALRCINYVLGMGRVNDIAKSFLLEAQACLTQQASDNISAPCVECEKIEFDKDRYCLHCGRRTARQRRRRITGCSIGL